MLLIALLKGTALHCVCHNFVFWARALDLRLQHCQIHYWAATAARLNVLDHHLINHSDAKKIHCWICHRAKVLFLMHTSRRWIIAWMCFGQWSNIELQLWQQCCSTAKSILRSALRVWVHCAVIKEHRLDAVTISTNSPTASPSSSASSSTSPTSPTSSPS